MERKTKRTVAGGLAEAKRGFDQWRRNWRRRTRIPERLWQLAVEAASVHGVHPTARQLRLNPTKLQERLQSRSQHKASQDVPGFVELPWLNPTPVPECLV